ncbi:MAG TPA: hypothetical protein VHE61_09895 [Opitutaceae bacterium]|nr:hypothetical protein [Opitutaceae bacterium]
MHNVVTSTYVTTDSGLVIEVRKVTPVYVRLGPAVRGGFAGSRVARVRRTNARRSRTERGVLCFSDDFSRPASRF